MNWYKLSKNEFDYTLQKRNFWREKIIDTQDQCGISFDLENDDNIDKPKKIKIDGIKYINDKPYYILAEICRAGGDWQNLVIYFRCQIIEGNKASSGSDGKFVFIPSKEQGNNNLLPSSKKPNKWIASDNNEEDDLEYDNTKCWKALKEYAFKYLKDKCVSCPVTKKASPVVNQDAWNNGSYLDIGHRKVDLLPTSNKEYAYVILPNEQLLVKESQGETDTHARLFGVEHGLRNYLAKGRIEISPEKRTRISLTISPRFSFPQAKKDRFKNIVERILDDRYPGAEIYFYP